jgi:hypothetical protein
MARSTPLDFAAVRAHIRSFGAERETCEKVQDL